MRPARVAGPGSTGVLFMCMLFLTIKTQNSAAPATAPIRPQVLRQRLTLVSASRRATRHRVPSSLTRRSDLQGQPLQSV